MAKRDSNNINIKLKRGIRPSTIAIIILSLLLLASVVVAGTLAYFNTTKTATGEITLGDPVDIAITQGGASVTSFIFEGNALPGTVYTKKIGITAPENTSDAVVRAKLTITNTDGAMTNVVATTSEPWTDNQTTDGYYYYNGVLSAGESIDFVEALTVPTSLTNDDANKTFNVYVVVEALQQANNAASAIWDTAPATWLSTYVDSTL